MANPNELFKGFIVTDESFAQEQQAAQPPATEVETETEDTAAAAVETKVPETDGDFDESKILKYLSEKRGKEFNSLDDLFKPEVKEIVKEVNPIDDEEILTAYKYKKETNRSLQDFLESQKDINALSEEDIAKKALKSQYPDFNSSDIEFVLRDEYLVGVDRDDMDESELKRAELKFKRLVSDGKKMLNQEKENYRIPVKTNNDHEKINAAREAWKTESQKALTDLKELDFGDYKYKIDGGENLSEKYSSLDSVLNHFKNESGFIDMKRMIATIEAGERRADAISALKTKIETEVTERIMKQKKNHGADTRTVEQGQKVGLDAATEAALRKMVGRVK